METSVVLISAGSIFNPGIACWPSLQRIDSAALVRRFGWLADHVKADVPPPARECLVHLAAQSRKTWLGPDPAREGVVAQAISYDKKWRLFVNVPREELHGSAGLGQRKPIRKGA